MIPTAIAIPILIRLNILKPLGTSLLGNLIIAINCPVNLIIILLKLTIDLGITYFLNASSKGVISGLIFLKT